MAFDFPNSPGEGTTYTPAGGPQWVYTGGVWKMLNAAQVGTAEARNRIVNGAMQVSQENGTSQGTTSGYYPVDQWQMVHASSSTITSNKSGNQIAIAAAPAETSAAAGEYVQLVQTIEGIRLADFSLGGASKQFVISFETYFPVAGTYWLAVSTPTATHSWLGSYTISAGEVNTYARKTVVVPAGAINAGTWATTTAACMVIHFTLHCGSTYVGVAGLQAGNFLAGPGQALGLSTTSPCYLLNVGLYLDPNATGTPPPWQMPDEAAEKLACQRYWNINPTMYGGWGTNVNVFRTAGPLIPEMRVTPALATVLTASRIEYLNVTIMAIGGASNSGFGGSDNRWVALDVPNSPGGGSMANGTLAGGSIQYNARM